MDTLTDRQRQVLDLWLGGSTQREVASALGISYQTVNPHLKVVARKLGANGFARETLRACLTS